MVTNEHDIGVPLPNRDDRDESDFQVLATDDLYGEAYQIASHTGQDINHVLVEMVLRSRLETEVEATRLDHVFDILMATSDALREAATDYYGDAK